MANDNEIALSIHKNESLQATIKAIMIASISPALMVALMASCAAFYPR